jgi:DNA topoisomerase-1
VIKQEGKLLPTEIAFKVVDHLSEYFKDLMDYQFTAQMEQKLDDIAI